MARARQNRKQWRPKAVIETAAAQHRSNVNHLVTSYLQERGNSSNTMIVDAASTKPDNPPIINDHSKILANSKASNASTLDSLKPVLPSTLRSSIHVTSLPCDQIDDNERDDIVLFVHHEQQQPQQRRQHNNYNKQESYVQILPPTTIKSNVKCHNSNCSAQSESHQQINHPTETSKAYGKKKSSSHNLTTTTNAIQTNNTKVTKRKAYSRMKKERKATQTLIIVLSMYLDLKKKILLRLSTLSIYHHLVLS